MSDSFPGASTSRADWPAHRLIVWLFRTVVAIATVWLFAINGAFLAAVLREFAPELIGTITRVLARGG